MGLLDFRRAASPKGGAVPVALVIEYLKALEAIGVLERVPTGT